MGEQIEVFAPAADFSSDADMTVLWHKIGVLIQVGIEHIGPSRTYSVLLSRVTREMRRELGTDGARAALQGFVDTMGQAAAGDRA
jgi:hypothetical protein